MKRLICITIFLLAVLTVFMAEVLAKHSAIAARSMDPDCINHGDVNLDDQITAEDAQQAFFIVLGLYSPTYEEECAADCNGDDDVTAGDAQGIFLVVLGLGECADPLIPHTPVPTETPTNTPIFVSVGNLIPISAGSFTQGSPGTEPCRGSNETQFTHTLTRNLAVMETEITRQMWADLLAVQATLPADPSHTTYSPTLSHPVQQNSWYEAILFANLLSMQNGHTPCYYADAGFTTVIDASNYMYDVLFCDSDADGYRLATEGEWEYFTRAGTTTAFSCNEPSYTSGTCGAPYCVSGEFPALEQHAVYCANDPGATGVAGSMLANPWNLKDAHGNLSEWCWDWYGTYPTGSATDYAGLATSSSRVLRGGSWDDVAQNCRSANRSDYPPGLRHHTVGFRLVRTTY